MHRGSAGADAPAGFTGPNGPGSAAGPTAYLLSGPAIDGGQLGQRRRGVVMVMIEDRAASAGNVEEGQLAGQEPPTAASLAALSTAPQVPPRRATS